MTRTRITPENAPSFIGAAVRFNYGCMHGSENAWVVGAETTRWGTHLICMTEKGQHHTVETFTDIGIGAYLLKMAEA